MDKALITQEAIPCGWNLCMITELGAPSTWYFKWLFKLEVPRYNLKLSYTNIYGTYKISQVPLTDISPNAYNSIFEYKLTKNLLYIRQIHLTIPLKSECLTSSDDLIERYYVCFCRLAAGSVERCCAIDLYICYRFTGLMCWL